MTSKRVLLAWEAGGGNGHLAILRPIAHALRERGYTPVFALQRTDQAADLIEAFGAANVLSAPRWPGLVYRRRATDPSRPTSMADVLALLGLRHRVSLDFMLAGWDELFYALRPCAVVADYAPACLLAASKRIPTVAVGDAFTLPPSHLTEFPNLSSDSRQSWFDETELLELVNGSLSSRGDYLLPSLPAIFRADRHCAGTFDEIDPYCGLRHVPVTAPWVPDWKADGEGRCDEVFCYLSKRSTGGVSIISGLAQVRATGVPVRVYAPFIKSEALDFLRSQDLFAEAEAVPFGVIQSRSRLIVSLGSGGLAATALAAGIPHIVVPATLPMELTGRATQALGTGRCLMVTGENPLEPTLLAQAIREAYEDTRMQHRARELAPDFLRRTKPPAHEVVANYVDELV